MTRIQGMIGKPVLSLASNLSAVSDLPPVGPNGQEHVHELRVRIPGELHRQLLSLKILRGKSLAETVSSALDAYFAEHAQGAQAEAS